MDSGTLVLLELLLGAGVLLGWAFRELWVLRRDRREREARERRPDRDR